MNRIVRPELLDELPSDDPRAIRSRRDLRRLNRLMRHADILRSTLEAHFDKPPRRLVEMGAGDGSLMLEIAEQNHHRWPNVRLIVVDRQNIISETVQARFRRLGWELNIVAADVFDWLAVDTFADAIVANLFLHHFSDETLAKLLQRASARTNLFVASETRRNGLSRLITRALWLFGCNKITRHDAQLSVAAGFRDGELSSLWPNQRDWEFIDRRAIAFTQLFVARRKIQECPSKQ